MLLLELLRFRDQLLEAAWKRLRAAHSRQLGHLAQVLAGLRLARSLFAALSRAQITKRENHMRGRLFGPILKQVGDIAKTGFVELVEGPPGSGDDFPRDPGPIDRLPTGYYSPSDTGAIPDADCTALAASGSVVISSHSASCSSVTSE